MCERKWLVSAEYSQPDSTLPGAFTFEVKAPDKKRAEEMARVALTDTGWLEALMSCEHPLYVGAETGNVAFRWLKITPLNVYVPRERRGTRYSDGSISHQVSTEEISLYIENVRVEGSKRRVNVWVGYKPIDGGLAADVFSNPTMTGVVVPLEENGKPVGWLFKPSKKGRRERKGGR